MIPVDIDPDIWGEFRIDQLFRVVKGSRLKSTDRTPGDIPYVGASQFNNGITHFIGNDEHLHPGGVLTVCYNGPVGTTFYQPNEFWATDDVNVLYPLNDVSPEALLFIAPIIEKIGSKYAYIDKWKLADMKAAIIKLPVEMSGNPDWVYMERVMHSIIKTQESKLELAKTLTVDAKPKALDVSKWREFQLTELFVIKNTKSITAAKLFPDSGTTPYVTAQDGNNGVQTYVSCPETWLDEGGCILIGGKTLTFSYQAVDFCSNDSHNIALYSKLAEAQTLPIQLFLLSVLRVSLEPLFSWGDSISKRRTTELAIRLPVDANGAPAWEYMESIMETLLEKKFSDLDVLEQLLPQSEVQEVV